MRPGTKHVLCMNVGSSSVKLAVFRMGAAEERLAEGVIDGIGVAQGHARLEVDGTRVLDAAGAFADHRAALEEAYAALARSPLPPLDAVGHRLVHGGADFTAPVWVDAGVTERLRQLVPLAPLHLPQEIEAITLAAERLPRVPQVACFDTAFHRRLPERAQRYPLPRWLWDQAVRRYGFHGLSYEYILEALGGDAAGRVIIAHLGNGASLVAAAGGRPLETTMGFSPTGGIMMSTRSGDLDPGVLVYLLRTGGYDAAALDRLVSREAGLLGVSGGTSDMRELLAARASDERAREAVEMFCDGIRKTIGAYLAVLGGADQLVFTGGIGEHAAAIREEACAGLEALGIELDPERNRRHLDVVSTPASRCAVRVIATDEERVIARRTAAMLAARERESRGDGSRAIE